MRENKLHLKWFMTIFILSFLVNEGGGGGLQLLGPLTVRSCRVNISTWDRTR